jgi:hypothetical protein
MCEGHQVSLFASGGRVSSVGLLYVDHRELSMRAITPEASRQAEGIILSLAAHVVETGARLRPGDAFEVVGAVVRIEHGGPSHLEVVRCDGGRGAREWPDRRAAEVAGTQWW